MERNSLVARIFYSILATALGWLPLIPSHSHAANPKSFLSRHIVSSTIPANGDLNPYGVTFVPPGFPSGGIISTGDVLVSNFNDLNNCQGQGTTIIQFTPSNPSNSVAPGVAPGSPGNATTFFSSSQLGLSTALGVLKGGFVIVGNVPSGPEVGGMCSPVASPGVLQVIDRNGNLVATWTDVSPGGNIYGSPWDLTIANDKGSRSSRSRGRPIQRDHPAQLCCRTRIFFRDGPRRLCRGADRACARSSRRSLCRIDERQRDFQGSER
jgi:hypothetical protein